MCQNNLAFLIVNKELLSLEDLNFKIPLLLILFVKSVKSSKGNILVRLFCEYRDDTVLFEHLHRIFFMNSLNISKDQFSKIPPQVKCH